MRSAPWTLLIVWLACAAVCLGPSSGDEVPGADRPGRPDGFKAQWIGQDGSDWTGPGPSVGPDGLQDIHIRVSGLAAGVKVKAIRVETSGGTRWESGINPRLLSNAELILDAGNPSLGDVYFQPDRDLRGQRLRVMVAYENEKLALAALAAGRCDAGLRVPLSPLPRLIEGSVKAKWLGQDGATLGEPGDVHVAVEGLPASLLIVGAVLTDAVWATWIYRANDGVKIPAEPNAQRLLFKPRADGTSADLFFPPYRDESKETMTLRLIAADGQNLLARFPGAVCDLGLMAPQPEPTKIEAKPGDDLQAFAEKYGTLVLTRGTYRLRRSLVLNRPITVTSDGEATLLFDQAASEPPWSAAIKVHHGNTTLNGFAVRFAGPVRWNNEISWGPAVIGVTDNFDPPHNIPKVNLAFTHLDLEIPPVEKKDGWVEALRLIRLIRAKSGVIAGNVLRGGPVEFFEGPWRIVDNDFRGTIPGTFSHGVFGGHGTHDLLLKGNRARDVGQSGKTWRFLVLTWQGFNDVVERNISEGLGAREEDTIPWSNEPEIILTEAYHVRYEGKVMDLSGDGRLLRTGQPQSITAGRTGDVVSLLQGPAAGEWRRIVQIIDPATYLVDRPIPAGTTMVSISTGFIDEVFQDNRIDIRGGRKSFGLVFVGNHFGTRIINNHLLGGESVFKLTACPTESPVMWGWTHAPFLGAVIERNILEDAERGGTLGVEHDPRYMKSNQGRTYMTARVDKNVVRWSEPFLRRMASAKATPAGLILGYPPSNDPDELVIHAGGNRLESASVELSIPSLVVHAAKYNSQRLINRRFRLPTASSDATGAGREARKQPGTNAR